ncbi:hypothetical protein LBMAG42_52700 [Deltaproteobacteria bacterium]|nr:hypothetical protein LBMAG42_52700 [Deltaproteobacteria bacterium]
MFQQHCPFPTLRAAGLLFFCACEPGDPERIGAKEIDTAPPIDTGDTSDTAADTATGDTADSANCPDPVVGDAGPDQTVNLADGQVQLDGAATGGCGPYWWFWALQAQPAGSTLSDRDIHAANLEDPTFTPTVAGDYVLSLAVYDGTQSSSPDIVLISVM